MYDGLMESLCEHSMRIESAHVSGNIAPLKIITKNTGSHMTLIYLLCLMLCLTACGSETYTELGLQNPPSSITMKEHERYRFAVKLKNASEGAIVTINDLPNWAEFDSETNIISGVPGHDNADSDYTFSIRIVDGENLYKSDDVTLSVLHSNLQILSAPKARAFIQELSSFSQSISVDTDISDLLYSLINAPEWMSINENTGEITGTPSHAYVGQKYSISVLVSDGFHERESSPFELTVSSILNLNPVISVTSNASGDFSVNQNMVISFDQVIDVEAISLAAPNGACVSNIQISEDDFSTCIALNPLYALPNYNYLEYDDLKTEEENQEIKDAETLRAENEAKMSNKLNFSSAQLEINKNYKLRVTTFVNEGFEYSMPADFDTSFYTISGLMISEVGSRVEIYDMHWFEVYNASRSAINLQDYKVRTRALLSNGCDVQPGSVCTVDNEHIFSLNSMLIQPGQYIVIRGNDWIDPYADKERTTYIGDGEYPYWDSNGYIELIHTEKNETEDYLVFGNWVGQAWVPAPLSVDAWGEDNYQNSPPVYTSSTIFSGSIGRSGSLSDSNSNADWQVYEVHTAGGPNDIADAETDQDQDGIPDYAETEGSTFAGMSLYELGARTGIKDIFIELDYMASEDEGVIPREESLQKVVDSFASHNIAVHFDAGDIFHQSPGLNVEKFDLGGGNEVPLTLGITSKPLSTDDRADLYEIKRSHMDNSRLPIFHYMLMAHSQQVDGSAGAAGFAEYYGNDSVITLGGWGLNTDDETSLNTLINIQASTIMHELGHNLGLMHGGSDTKNYKPNYLSVMNYLYSLQGLPTIGDNEGDRYYNEKNYREGAETCELLSITNPMNGDYQNFIIDYASNESSLNETKIFESNGLNIQGSSPIDFNCDGNLDDILVNFDINFSNNISELNQESDWDRISLKFQKHSLGNFGASLFVRQPYDIKLIEDVVGDDSAEIIFDKAYSQSQMDEIREM